MRLYVQPWFGIEIGRPTGWDDRATMFYERVVLSLFKSHGYDIARTEECKQIKEGDISMIFNSPEPDTEDIMKSPNQLTPLEVISNEKPVVAKLRLGHFGKGKFLLETTLQKMIFMAYLLSDAPFSETRDSLKRHLDQIADFNLTGINQAELSWWKFEEFIESPGDYFASFRAIPGIDRKIYISKIFRSNHSKSEHILVREYDETGAGNFLPLIKRHNIFASPKSPYYLESREIISNYKYGFKSILLDGSRIKNREDRELAAVLGINPNKALLPKRLIEPCIEMTYRDRKSYPFHGIDLITSLDQTDFKMELNRMPGVNPADLGLPSEVGQYGAYLYLLCNIAKIPLDVSYLEKIAYFM